MVCSGCGMMSVMTSCMINFISQSMWCFFQFFYMRHRKLWYDLFWPVILKLDVINTVNGTIWNLSINIQTTERSLWLSTLLGPNLDGSMNCSSASMVSKFISTYQTLYLGQKQLIKQAVRIMHIFIDEDFV